MRTVFIGTPAFLGRIDSATRVAFWADEPDDHGFDPQRLITVDLALTPNAAASDQIRWDAVQVDDCFGGPNGNLGGTTIGPRWPELQLAGAVYLEHTFWQRLPAAIRPPCPPHGANARDYEYKTVLYWPKCDAPRSGRRYAGHHAEILEERGTLARVAIYPQGSSTDPSVRPTTMWIDLSSAEQCDAGSASLTEIGPGEAPKRGALFLISGTLTG